MRNQTIFIDLKGKTLGDYVTFIFRKIQTNNKEVQMLQTQLNIVIKESIGLEPTAKNCKNFWETLTGIMYQTNPEDRKDEACKEIIDQVDKIGKKIAYLCKRSGISNRAYSEGYTIPYEYDKQRDKEPYTVLLYLLLTATEDNAILDITKRILLLMYNNGQLSVNDSTYHTMTDEELINYGKSFAKHLRDKGYRTCKDRAKQALNNLENSVSSDIRERLMSDVVKATLPECELVVENALKQIKYIKDRMTILHSGDQTKINQLHKWDIDEPDSHYISDDFGDLLQRVAEFTLARKMYYDRAGELIQDNLKQQFSSGVGFKLVYDEELE